MLVTCFSTARSVTNSRRRSPGSSALGHQLEHLALARGELLERVVAPRPTSSLTTGGIERRAAVGHASHGRAELLQVRDPVLEEVPDSSALVSSSAIA